ncbi:MAG: malonyl-ACP O-methyltransferase BioC [Methylococcales bacterium]|nr:malonyl-ACP O-methyltransferase BioC [Methylococcales bacterium]
MKSEYRLDKAKIQRAFAAAADSYDAAAALQRQVGLTLLRRFPLQPQPGVILDLGCGTGFLTRQMVVSFEHQPRLAMDIALPMLAASRQRNTGLSVQYLCADAEKMPFRAGCIQQVYSNLALQWCQLATVFADCRRLLAADGQLVFATFGPATLRELKAAWMAVDDFSHVNEFVGAVQIDACLRQAGFQQIACETVVYPVAYPSVMALMRELKGLGAHNVNTARNREMTTRKQMQKMIASYEAGMAGAEIIASYEIIYVRAGRQV